MRRFVLIAAALAATAAGCARPAATPPLGTPAGAGFIGRMQQLAAIGSGVIDGDDCLNIVTDRAARLMFARHARDPWAGADNYEVDHATFIRQKKLLIRLSRLVDFPVDCNLWLTCRKDPAKVQMVIRQVNNWSLFYHLGQMHIDPTPEMKKLLAAGEPVVVDRKSARIGVERKHFVAVLSPVRTSMGDVIGFIEVCAPAPEQEKSN